MAKVDMPGYTQDTCYCGNDHTITITITITLSTTTPGAQIRWTNDGTDPTSGNPSTQVIAGSSGNVSGSGQYEVEFKAVAFEAGMLDSDEADQVFFWESGGGANAAQVQSQSVGALAYDANGNLTNYKGWTYTYDAQNRLTKATNVPNGTTTATFYYDGKNRQIARYVSNSGIVRFSAWDGWELLEEYGSGVSPATSYLQGSIGVIKSWGGNGTFYYYQDKLGSTTHIADASGALLESYKYDLYGTPSYFNSTSQPLNSSSFGIVDLYAGERWISELSLYDLRNRMMSPELGRFLQTDPIGFKGDASNLYRYCHNDPEDFSDPTGLFDMWGNSTRSLPAIHQ
jgi:RHS repeat-associated protein